MLISDTGMIKFDWDEFKHRNFCVVCNSEDEAIDFVKKCYENDIEWTFGNVTETMWKWNTEDISYFGGNGMLSWSCLSSFSTITKIFYRDINWEESKVENLKNLLKTGMRIITRNGDTGIVMLDWNGLGEDIIQFEDATWCHLSAYKDDLIYYDSDDDIMKIEYPLSKSNITDYKTKWERVTVEEMTMEQICKELGRTVKIIK